VSSTGQGARPGYLRIPAAAAHVGVAPITVHRRIKRGVLPAVAVGKHHEVAIVDLEQAFAARPVQLTADSRLGDIERAARRVAAEAPTLGPAARERLRDILSGALGVTRADRNGHSVSLDANTLMVAPARGKGLSIAAPISKTPGRTSEPSPRMALASAAADATFSATFRSPDPKVAFGRDAGAL
jgi:hypothetical protein